jgi:hypothetical protein
VLIQFILEALFVSFWAELCFFAGGARCGGGRLARRLAACAFAGKRELGFGRFISGRCDLRSLPCAARDEARSYGGIEVVMGPTVPSGLENLSEERDVPVRDSRRRNLVQHQGAIGSGKRREGFPARPSSSPS